MYAQYLYVAGKTHEFPSRQICPTYLDHTSSKGSQTHLNGGLQPVRTGFEKISNWWKCLNLQLLAQFLPTSTANFEHILIFSESLFAQNHFGTTGTKIHPILKEINIAPRNWSDLLKFYGIVIYVIHWIIISNLFFCSSKTRCKNPI